MSGLPKLPSLGIVLAALRFVDDWFRAQAAAIKLARPELSDEVDAILLKVLSAEAVVAELLKLADAVAVLRSGRGPTAPDDSDLA
ncbi:MAG: hypothetical protein ABL977_10795 [Candidatus Eisenbacteria bacterium]